MFCPRCGAKAGNAARFCPKCGQALKTVPPTPQPEPPVPPSPRVSTKTERSGKGGNRLATLLPVLALLLALGAGCLVIWSASDRTSPDKSVLENDNASAAELMAEGNAAYSAEDYELALDFYLEVIRRFPDQGDARSRAGDACYRLEREDEALGHYQAALMIYGDGTLPLRSAQNYYHLTED